MTTPETQNFRKRASGAVAAWTPTGGRAIRVMGPHRDTGKFTLQVKYAPRQSSKKGDYRLITSEHPDYPGKPGFLGCYHLKAWTTKAAAEAAVPHFRHWVDNGRRKQTAAATTVSNRKKPRIEADLAAVGDGLPQRYSVRNNLGTKISA